MKIIIFVYILCLLGISGADYAHSNTFTQSLATTSNEMHIEYPYTDVQLIWDESVSGKVEVSAYVQADAKDEVDFFTLALAEGSNGVALTFNKILPTLAPTLEPVPVATKAPTNGPDGADPTATASPGTASPAPAATTTATPATTTTTATTGADRTVPQSSGASTTAPLAILTLLSLFALPKNRLTVGILLIALVFAMGHSSNADSANVSVTLRIKVPTTINKFCVNGACFSRDSNGVVTSYQSLFGKRYASLNAVAGVDCTGVMKLPTGWKLATFDDAAKRLAIWNVFGGVQYAFDTRAAYSVVTATESVKFAWEAADDGYKIISGTCDTKLIITQDFPIPEKSSQLVGQPFISNFVTFNGYDYAAADNTPYADTSIPTGTQAQTHVYVDANSEWVVAPDEASTLIAIQGQTDFTFGTNHLVLSSGKGYNYQLESSISDAIQSFDYGSGKVYTADVNKGNVRLLVRRKTSSTPSWSVSVPATNSYLVNGANYATLDNINPNAESSATAKLRFQSVPAGWVLASADELTAFVAAVKYEKFRNTYCFAVEGAALDPSGAACAGNNTLLKQTVGSVNYYVTKSVGRVLIKSNVQKKTDFIMGMKVLLLTVSDNAVLDGEQALAMTIFNATGAIYDKVHLIDGDKTRIYAGDLPLLDAAGNPKYYAIVMASSTLPYVDTLGASHPALTDAQKAQLTLYKYQYSVRLVALASYPGLPLNGFKTTTAAQSGNENDNVGFDDAYVATNPAALGGLVTNATYNITGAYYSPCSVIPSNAQAILRLTSGAHSGEVVAVIISNGDATEEMHFFIANSVTTDYGTIMSNMWFNWVTKGLWVGQRRVYLSPHVDDLLLATTEFGRKQGADGSTSRMTGDDLDKLYEYLVAVKVPAGSDRPGLEFAVNGGGAVTIRGKPNDYSTDTLYQSVQRHAADFHWESHTWDHLDFTCVQDEADGAKNDHDNCYLGGPTTYEQAHEQLRKNIEFFNGYLYKPFGGVNAPTFSTNCMVTPAITGMKNPLALKAIWDNDIKCLVGDNSVSYLIPENKYHGVVTTKAINGFDGVFVIPRQATEVYYDVSTPETEVAQYNYRYGTEGTIKKLAFNKTLEDIMAYEAEINVRLLTAFRHDPYMFHQANGVHFPYALPGEDVKQWSLLTMWIEFMINKYTEVMSFPILHAGQQEEWELLKQRMAFDECEIEPSFSVVKNVVTQVTLKAEGVCKAPVTGLASCGDAAKCEHKTYGPDSTVYLELSDSSATLPATLAW